MAPPKATSVLVVIDRIALLVLFLWQSAKLTICLKTLCDYF